MNNKIGITERGDASLDFSWVNKLSQVSMAIIITKNVTDKVIEHLLVNKDKIILHATVTGHGQSEIEPNIPKMLDSYKQIKKLIKAGFPAKQIVLRIDPIIPTDRGIDTACRVLELFSDTEIERVGYSFLDLYPHVKERFKEINFQELTWNTFTAPISKRVIAENTLEIFSDIYNFEVCAEDSEYRRGCISDLDLEILGLDTKLEGKASQRQLCLCPSNKLELLTTSNRCSYGCVYCYWKD